MRLRSGVSFCKAQGWANVEANVKVSSTATPAFSLTTIDKDCFYQSNAHMWLKNEIAWKSLE